jgi:hypothetical protein
MGVFRDTGSDREGALQMVRGSVNVPRLKGDKKGQPRRRRAIAVSASDAWRDWFEKGCEHVGMNVSHLVDMAVRDYLKDRGYDAPPPKR